MAIKAFQLSTLLSFKRLFFFTCDCLTIQQFLDIWNIKSRNIGVSLPNVLSSREDLLCDLGGDGDAGLADQGPEQPAHGPEVLHVDGAQLRHAPVLPVEVVLALLVGVRQHGVGCTEFFEFLCCLLVSWIL